MTQRDPHRRGRNPAQSAVPAPPANEAKTQRSGRSERSELSLAGDFPPASRERWRELVAGVLRKAGRELDGGAPDEVERLLASALADGVSVAPLYTADDAEGASAGMPGLAPFTRGGRALGSSPDGWDVRARHADPDVTATSEAVLADLENGVGSLWLVLGEGAIPVESLRTVLAGVYLDMAPIALDAGAHIEAAAAELLGLADEREVPRAALAGTLGADPLGRLAAVAADTDLDAGLDTAGALAARCARERPNLRAVTVDATAYHGAGADDAQELACSLAAGVAYLRALTASDTAGLTVPDALAQIEFRYAATADQFATIAKLRAARALWSRVAAECDATGPEAAQRQHAVSSEVMVTARDPWVNMLRTTLAAFGAGVGGADAVTVLPFDAALGLPDAFSRRMARNTQSLLVAESHLARVVDPAGGSWYVESLTTALARRAWELFTEIERAGGLAAVLRDGSLAERLATTWRARERNLATRKEPVTGVSEFPNLDERAPVRPPDPRPAPHGLLPRVRRAAAFEALRDRAQGHDAHVFLAALGPAARHTARVGFASNLFQAGGLATPTGTGTTSELADAFAKAGTTVACLCGADRDYDESAPEVTTALRQAGATTVLLAGRPGTADNGVDGYIHTGCDAVEILTRTLDELGVPA
ncbi:methylmalonyl-CoA mutase family protein [Pseudonocardia acaciae]|uniref:methylmalonyl-CoA mutase family protein n=1 Tax=Pseudonocardia acaciae TaxID=551276 RepID=UPI000A0527FB|nr:methylmalonyl-CoA mutase family protein [Pseudonocardia acaciae]